MTWTKDQIGDKGQRYEHSCDDGQGSSFIIGYSDDPNAFRSSVDLHPCWNNYRTRDRRESDKCCGNIPCG